MNSNKLCIVACFTILTCVSHANEVIRNVQFNMKIVGNWTVLNFTFVLYRRPIGDAVLIQINSSTVDVIRYKNNTCYDRDKECQNDTCFCSDDGHTFKIVYWYKKPKASRSYNFGIETLLNDSKANIVTVTLSRFYNGQGFEKLQIVKETSRYNFMETIDQTDNSLKNECSKLQTNSLALSATNGKNVWIALPTSVLIVFYLLCTCLYHAFDLWRNRKHSRLKSLETTGETYSMIKATDNVSITIVSTAVDIRNVDNKLFENPSFESSSEEMPMLHQKSKMQSHSSNSKDEICLPFIPGSNNEEEQMRCSALDEQFVPTCILGQMVHGIRSNVIPKKICGALQFASVPTMGIELMYSDCIGQWMYPTQFHYDKNEEKIKPRFNISYLIDDQEPPVGIDCTWKDVVSYEAEEEFENYWLLGVKELDKQSAMIFATVLEEEGYHHFEASVIIAGEQDNCETTVARFLVGKGPTKNRISTGGIDLCYGLFYIDSKTEEWLYGKQDFTLSEIAISRSMRQEDNTSTNLKENVNKAHLDKFSPVSLACFVLAKDIGGSEGCSSHASFMKTKKEFNLTDSAPVNNDAIHMSSVTAEEEHSGDRSLSINTNDYDESKTMKHKHSTYDENGNQTLPEGKIVKLKTLIESSPVLTTQSTEKKTRRENILIAPGKVFLELTTGRLNKKMAADVDLYVPETDKVVFSDAVPRLNEGTRTHDAKTVLLLGATGTGKSTLIDAIINYMAGESYNDDCRFSVINLEDNHRPDKQFESQTSSVTVYRIPQTKGSRLGFNVDIIDTPGYNDSGKIFDKPITDQIKELFYKTIKHLDQIVLPFSITRLTNAQQHVFSSILTMFGHDIFRFNNAKLYFAFSSINNQSTNTEIWKGRTNSFSELFPKKEVTQKTTVKSSKEVNRARQNLEIALADKLCQKDYYIVNYKEDNTVLDAFEKETAENKEKKMYKRKVFVMKLQCSD